jgi:hypothetical protein
MEPVGRQGYAELDVGGWKASQNTLRCTIAGKVGSTLPWHLTRQNYVLSTRSCHTILQAVEGYQIELAKACVCVCVCVSLYG